MKKYRVSITTLGCGTTYVDVEAESSEEAIRKGCSRMDVEEDLEEGQLKVEEI